MQVINTALLSFGLSGRVFHAPFLQQNPGFRLCGCWERSASAFQDHYPQARSYDSLEQILGDPAIDLVVVNTPTATHFDYAAQALEHGKHVLVEKAFTDTAAEAQQLELLAKRLRLKLAVFHNRRWDSDYQSVCNVVAQGLIGDIVEANFAFCRFNPALSSKAHKEMPGPGSGIVKDLGSHLIDQAVFLFGMPHAVSASIGITRQHSRVDDDFHILLHFQDKRVHLKGGYFFKQPLAEYALFGRQGSFIKHRADVQESQLQDGMKPDEPGYGMEPESAAGQLCRDNSGLTEVQSMIAPLGNYSAFYEALYASIRHDQREPVSASDGVRVMKIIDAAFQSQRDGRRVTI